MERQLALVVYPAKDLATAKAFYERLLGVAPYADQPYYVGFRIGNLEIGLDPRAHEKGLDGAVTYWGTTEIEHTLKTLVSAGAKVQQPVSDVGGGRRIAVLRDVDGSLIGLLETSAA